MNVFDGFWETEHRCGGDLLIHPRQADGMFVMPDYSDTELSKVI